MYKWCMSDMVIFIIIFYYFSDYGDFYFIYFVCVYAAISWAVLD